MHISKSQINSYLRCPFAYHCRYNLGMKIAPSSAMTLGRCFDHCINVDYTEKIKTGHDEPVSVVTDAFASAFDIEKKETAFEADENPEKLKDSSIPAIKKFHAEVCSLVTPASVQLEDEVTFGNVDWSLKVIVDCIDTDGVIIDNKFKRRGMGDVGGLLDAPIYSAWYYAKYKSLPRAFSYDVAVCTKEPKAERVTVPVDESMVTGALIKIGMIKDSIMHDTERGAFFPNTTSFSCSRRGCGFAQECERQWKHIIKP